MHKQNQKNKMEKNLDHQQLDLRYMPYSYTYRPYFEIQL